MGFGVPQETSVPGRGGGSWTRETKGDEEAARLVRVRELSSGVRVDKVKKKPRRGEKKRRGRGV